MTCHDAAAALVDDRTPRTPELRAHLRQCAECRGLAALHASASRLRPPEPPPQAPIPREAVLREVRRRIVRRRVSAGAVASLAVAALLLWVRPRDAAPEAPADVRFEEGGPVYAEGSPLYARDPNAFQEEALAEEAATDTEGSSLGQLLQEVRGYTRRDVVVRDEAYQPFGTLASWLRPPDVTALDSSPFRKALYPLHSMEALR